MGALLHTLALKVSNLHYFELSCLAPEGAPLGPDYKAP